MERRGRGRRRGEAQRGEMDVTGEGWREIDKALREEEGGGGKEARRKRRRRGGGGEEEEKGGGGGG
jgi:hypothetical protein